MNYGVILCSQLRKRTAIVKLNRPKQMNALNSDLIRELDHAIEAIKTDASIRAVVISGEKEFCRRCGH
ncbi:MAG: enoyl-CoA hydratase/isomerase family protein [Desulfobacterales bacterium]